MVKILLVGKSAHQNFGDILMAGLVARWVVEMGFQPVLFSQSKEFSRHVEGIEPKCLSTSSLESEKNVIAGIFYGGGYFGHNYFGFKKWGNDWLKEAYFESAYEYLCNCGIPYAVYSVEFGPIYNRKVRDIVKSIILKSDQVVTRNSRSSKYVKKITGKEVENGGDIIFSTFNKGGHKGGECIDGTEIVIHYTDKVSYKNLWTISYLSSIKDALEGAGVKKVTFVSDSAEVLIDQKVVSEFTSVANVSRVDFVDVSHLMEKIATCTHLITTKLHLGVLALSMGKNVLCVSDHPKIKRFYMDLNLENKLISFYFSPKFLKNKKIKEFLGQKHINNNRVHSCFDYESRIKGWLSALPEENVVLKIPK